MYVYVYVSVDTKGSCIMSCISQLDVCLNGNAYTVADLIKEESIREHCDHKLHM